MLVYNCNDVSSMSCEGSGVLKENNGKISTCVKEAEGRERIGEPLVIRRGTRKLKQ